MLILQIGLDTNSLLKRSTWSCQVLSKLTFIEGIRGNLAAWMLIGFGLALLWCLKHISFKALERLSHVIAGFTIFSSGMAIQFLGL